MPVWFRSKYLLRFFRIATHYQYIVYSEKLKVYKRILGFFLCETAADNMGNYKHIFESVFYSCRNCYGSRTLAYCFFFKQSAAVFFINNFFLMIGNIYVSRIEFQQRINGHINSVDVISFKRRKELKRKTGFFRCI